MSVISCKFVMLIKNATNNDPQTLSVCVNLEGELVVEFILRLITIIT